MSMKTMKTNDENTYLSFNSKTKRKQTTSLNAITQIYKQKCKKKFIMIKYGNINQKKE